MSRVITFSRTFPAYHPKKGQLTFFVEKLVESINTEGKQLNTQPFDPPLELHVKWNPKQHTIRAGHRFKVGDYFSPRVWSGKPYYSKHIIIAPDIEVKKVWNFIIHDKILWLSSDGNKALALPKNQLHSIAKNDGLSSEDFMAWFQYPKPFDGQIICWNESINY